MLPPLAEHSLPGTTFSNSVPLHNTFREAKVCAQPEGEPEWPKHGNSNLNSCLANFRLAKVQVSEAEVSQARVLAPACSTASTARGRAGQAELSYGEVELPLHCKNYLLLYTHLTVILFFASKNTSGASLALALLPIPT